MIEAANWLPEPGALRNGDIAALIIDGQEYMLPPFDLRMCVVALQRYLLSLAPMAAEERWWLIGQHHHNNQWCEIRGPGAAPWFRYSDGIRGRSGFTLPPDVSPNDVIVITLPCPGPTVLRSYFSRLIDQFNDHDPDERQWKESKRAQAKPIGDMYDPSEADRVISTGIRELHRILVGGKNVQGLLEDFLSRVSAEYSNFQIACQSACDLLLIAKISCLAWRYRFMFLPGLGIEATLAASGRLESLLTGIVYNSKVPGEMLKVIRGGCDHLQSKGEELQDSAMDARHIGEFYGRSFSCAPWILGAMRGLNFLLAQPDKFSQKELRIEVNACDERLAIALSAMEIQFSDTLTHREILSRLQLIEKRRDKDGPAAAEQLADQYIEIEMLYPPFTKPFLIGETHEFKYRKS